MPESLEAVQLSGNRSTSLARSLTARSGETLQQCAALLLHSNFAAFLTDLMSAWSLQQSGALLCCSL